MKETWRGKEANSVPQQVPKPRASSYSDGHLPIYISRIRKIIVKNSTIAIVMMTKTICLLWSSTKTMASFMNPVSSLTITLTSPLCRHALPNPYIIWSLFASFHRNEMNIDHSNTNKWNSSRGQISWGRSMISHRWTSSHTTSKWYHPNRM